MKLECINATFSDRYHRNKEIYPVKGQIYTLRHSFTEDGTTYIQLNEIVNPHLKYHGYDGLCEMGFNLKRFRPITDISAFTKLTKVKELEEV